MSDRKRSAESSGLEAEQTSTRRKSGETATPEQGNGGDEDLWRFRKVAAEKCVVDGQPEGTDEPITSINEETQEALVTKMARYILLKGSAKEPLDLKRMNDDVLGEYKKQRNLKGQIFRRAAQRVKNVMGYHVLKAPEAFKQPRFKDTYYVINGIKNPELNSDLGRDNQAPRRGLLMVILGVIYSSHYNSESHKATEKTIVDALDKLDPLPASQKSALFDARDWPQALDHFAKLHYIIKTKEADSDGNAVNIFQLGPRAYLEVGRRQIVYFVHEAVGDRPESVLIEELDQEERGEEVGDEG